MYRSVSCAILALIFVSAQVSWGLEGGEKVEFLLNSLESANDPKVRIAAATELGKIANGTLADWMIRAFRKEENPAVRLAILYAIGRIPEHLIIPPLLELIGEEILSQAEMVAVERIIWNYRICISQSAWSKALLESKDQSERSMAAYLLGLVADSSYVNVLQAATQDPIAYVRFRAVQAIGRIGTPNGGPICRRISRNDPDSKVRKAGETCLGEIELSRSNRSSSNSRRTNLKVDLAELRPNSLTPAFVQIYKNRNVNPRALESALANLQQKMDIEERVDRTYPVVKSETTRDTIRFRAELITKHDFPKVDLDRLREVVRDNIGYVNQCYLAALKTDRKLKGELAARFLILENGSVSSIEFTNVTLKNEEVQHCVADRIRAIAFPQLKFKFVTMNYTFAFFPPKDKKFEFSAPGEISAHENRPSR